MPPARRKTRTRQHIIADLSVNHVERHILRCGWTAQRVSPDYGVDLVMATFNRRGEIENGDVRFQIKATDKVKRTAGWRFEHSASGTLFLFRPYSLVDKVSMPDLVSTRMHLDWRGLLSASAFDDSFAKTPA